MIELIKNNLICLTLLCFNIVAFSQESDIKFEDLKVYSRGYNEIDRSEREYKSEFLKSKTSYIALELIVTNELYEKYDEAYKVTFMFYKPDNNLLCDFSVEFNVKSDWYTSWRTVSWGWNNPGNWVGGEYIVNVFVDGYYFGETTFEIINDYPKLELESISFFEGGVSSEPDNQIDYSKTFSSETSRYIYYILELKNNYSSIEHQLVKFKVNYYYEDGTLFGETEFEYSIPETWEDFELWYGLGWEEPGYWETGNYKVKVYMGEEYAGEAAFSVY